MASECPRCGAKVSGRSRFGHDCEETSDSFMCGSAIYSTDGFHQSDPCCIAELTARVAALEGELEAERMNAIRCLSMYVKLRDGECNDPAALTPPEPQ